MNISFKSTLVPTEYLKSAFDYSISQGFEGHNFLGAAKLILNDGKDDVIKIDATPERKGRHDIFVNSKKVVDADYHFCAHNDGEQCVSALINLAAIRSDRKFPQNIYSALDKIQNGIIGCIDRCNIADGSKQPEQILKDVQHVKEQQRKLPYDSNLGCVSQMEQILKSVLYIKQQQENQVTKELIGVKNKIFG